MSPYTYNPPSSPTFGFFPTGATSPNAFAPFHQSPRDKHAMYSAFTSAAAPQQNTSQQGQGSISTLKNASASHYASNFNHLFWAEI
ncbi:hypothetical protein BDQ17DRAFT_1440164 [Cyathus striatus]|nr:hypothetical protein BDQ17DRAFT_1440164 [Cyathus striatus]